MVVAVERRTVGGFALLLVLFGALFSAACGQSSEPDRPRVAVLLARGGLGDRSFNDSAAAAAMRIRKEVGGSAEVVLFKETPEAQLANARAVAAEDFDLIVGVGAENVAAITALAKEFPDQRLAIADGAVEAPNVTSVVFSELEGDFLAGALSALLADGGPVAFIGGADIAVIRRIEDGWRQGVLFVNPEAVIDSELLAGKDDFSGFTNPGAANRAASRLYGDGAKVIYVAAGGSALGAIAASKAVDGVMITTGSDQRHLAPGNVVTSRTKNVDVAILGLVKALKAGTLEAGTSRLDYRNGGIGLAGIKGKGVTPEVLLRLRQIERGILDGTLKVEPVQ